MFTIACHYWSLYHLPVTDAIAEAARRGYRAMDLGTGDIGYGDTLPAAALADRVQVDAIAATAAACGIALTDLFLVLPYPVTTLDTGEQAENDRLAGAVLAQAARIGVSGITVSPGPRTEDWEHWRAATGSLGRLVKVASEHGVRAAVEPHVESITETVDAVQRLLGDVPGLGLTLDYSHLVAAGEPQSAIASLDPLATHWHARQAAPGKISVTRMAGQIDFRPIVAGLLNRRFAGSVAVEYVRSSWQRQDELDVDAENDGLRDALQEIAQGLRAELP